MMSVARAVISAACLAIVCGGCTAVKVCNVGKPMVEVENNGWFLFNVIPLASGNAEDPESNICCLFQNTVNLDNNIDLIDYAVRKTGAVGVKELVSYTSDESVLIFLLKRHSMHTSAVLVMEDSLDDECGEVHQVESKRERDPEGTKVNEIMRPDSSARGAEVPVGRRTRADAAPVDPPAPAKIRLLDF